MFGWQLYKNGLFYTAERWTIETTKLTIRVSRTVFDGAKQYARENQTTLTRLVSEYLRQLTAETDPLAKAPIV